MTKVLYIVGYERSGSTLLHNVLAQITGAFGGGEILRLWDRGLRDNPRCCDGYRLLDHPIWGPAVQRLGDTSAGADIAPLNSQVATIKRSFLPVGGRLRKEQNILLTELYTQIESIAEASFIVDSSKSPAYLRALLQLPQLEIYPVHVVRDPRGVEYSKQKRREKDHPYYSNHRSIMRPALGWAIANYEASRIVAQTAPTSISLRYEDFVINPKKYVEAIFSGAGISYRDEDLTYIQDDQLTLQHTASFSGSEHGHDHAGSITLKPDDRWREKLPATAQRKITRLCGPLLHKYGYV